MTISGKLSRLIRERLSRRIMPNQPTSTPDAIRYMSKKRLFVGGIPSEFTYMELRKLFIKFGRVDYVKVPIDPATNKSRGFGFVTFKTQESAVAAINELNGLFLEDQYLHIEPANELQACHSGGGSGVGTRKG